MTTGRISKTGTVQKTRESERSASSPCLLRGIKGRRIRVIGIGGIGSSLSSYLARFLWSQNAKAYGVSLDLIDGDHYELRNKERQLFPLLEGFSSKPVAKAMELAREFGDRLLVRPIPEYVKPSNIHTLVGEGDIVFLAVDNFKTRKHVSDRSATLKGLVLFSGGNDGVENGQSGTFGNIQIYERKNGRDLKNPITRLHPEIASPEDKAPNELSCEELALGSAPQLLFTNLAVASVMLNSFYSWLQGKLEYEEAYLDILCGTVQPAQRAVSGDR